MAGPEHQALATRPRHCCPAPARSPAAACHTRTGYPAIDSIRYARPPLVEALGHPETGLILYRMHSQGPAGALTSAERDGTAPAMLFVSRGGGVAAHGHVAGRRFELRPNSSVRATFLPAGADAGLTFGVAARSVNLLFPVGLLESGLEQGAAALPPLLFNEDERLIRLARMVEGEIARPGFASALLVEGLARAIAALLARADRARLDAEADRVHLPAWKLRRVIDHVEANLGGRIGLADLAAAAGLSPFHFSRVFRRATGTTPHRFVMERRLQQACARLADPSVSIAETALACGFANQSHFTAAFSRSMGISPARYRALLHR